MLLETWLPVPGYEGLYEVSDLGRVYAFERTVRIGRGRIPLHIPARILKPATNSNPYGHLRVTLYRDGKRADRPVHQLVLEAFHGPRPPGKVARHGPAGKLDNAADNLCWGTPTENHEDAHRDGTCRLAGHLEP